MLHHFKQTHTSCSSPEGLIRYSTAIEDIEDMASALETI
jgi:hypothetical protein